MTHYIVGYHDYELKTHEVCEYAHDSYEARVDATEDVPYIHDHPNCIDYILTAD
tara:strand:+ start:899 stop:1060 length:162 start_codon:yes stop_codon:yes gene_type:complete